MESWKNYDIETKKFSPIHVTHKFFFFSQNWPPWLLRWGGQPSPRSPTPTTRTTTAPCHPSSRRAMWKMTCDWTGMSAKSYTNIILFQWRYFSLKNNNNFTVEKFSYLLLSCICWHHTFYGCDLLKSTYFHFQTIKTDNNFALSYQKPALAPATRPNWKVAQPLFLQPITV